MQQNKSESLFTRLGGQSTIDKIFEAFSEKLSKSEELTSFYKDVDTEKLKTNAKAFYAHMFGGPNDYKGKSIPEAHKHLNINEGHLNLYIHLFRAVLTELKIDDTLANECTWTLEKYRGDVINKKTLFERLGGDQFFDKLGEILGEKILADDLIGPIYKKADFKRANSNRMTYIRLLFGGKVEYTGKSIHEAHAQHHLNDRHFDRFLFVFEESLASLQVSADLMRESVMELEKTRFKITNKTPLSEQLGGMEAMRRIVPKFHELLLQDETLRPFFEKSDMTRLNEGRIHYFASVWGGAHSYFGQSMSKAHGGHKITDDQFNLFLKYLYLTFMQEGVKEDLAYQAIEVLDLTRDQVLNRKTIFERLGGMEDLTKITEEFHKTLRADKVLGPFYAQAPEKQLVKFYTKYFAHIFGALDLNANTSLRSTHGSSKLTDSHYDLFLQLFRQTLVNRKIDDSTIEQAVRLLNTKRNEVLSRESLWSRLGGFQTMDKVVAKFEELLLKDPTLGPMHKNVDMKRYHETHRDLFAELFNGWHFYSGKSLNEAHRTFKLNDEHFNLFVDLFVRALKESSISEEMIGEVRKTFELERNEVLNRRSLYEKLGGEKAMDLLTEKLNQKLANDPTLGPMHKNVDWAKLQLHRKQFFTKLFGNLDVYEGKDLRSAHSQLNLSEEHFTMFEKHFKDVLGEMGFTEEPIKQALTLLETTKREVLNSTSLYDKLGGKEGLAKFVTTLDQLSAKNPELAPFFEKVDMGKLNEHRLQYFSNMFGGQTKYEGKSMSGAHTSLPLSDKHLKVFLELVQDALKEVGAEQSVKDEVVMMLQTKRNEVINQ